jgi:hypothetical protein
MKNIGFVIAVFSLASIIYSDFKFKKVKNLSLVFLALGMGIFLPSQNLLGSTVQLLVSGGVLILINRALIKKNKTKIQPGDLKLILILSFFLKPDELALVLAISSVVGLIFFNKKQRVLLGAILSLIVLGLLSYFVALSTK